MRNIDFIVLHCTATPQTTTVESIKRHWKDVLKWKSVGYHRLIEPDGTINKLSHFDNPTNGVKGFNHNSIHISYIGGVDSKNKPLDNRTDAQKAAIEDCIYEAISYIKSQNPSKKFVIQGHRDFPGVSKACPSYPAKQEYSWMSA